jgi:hypothetical protein
MSPLFRPGLGDDHERARELAALRLDEPLVPGDVVWLDAHLGTCASCREVADAYDEGHFLFRGLRDAVPEPPRDLWARTAAAIEADGSRGGARVGRRRWLPIAMPLAPVAGLLVVAVAVGVGLLNGVNVIPGPGTPPSGTAAAATPIPLTAGDVQVLVRGADGALELRIKQIDEVCPVGADTCGASDLSAGTALADIGDFETLGALLSPGSDQLVLMERGAGASGVIVVPVRRVTDPTPPPATPIPGPTATPDATAEPTDPGATPDVPGSPGATVEPSPEATPEATPEPSVAVTAAPDGTLEIAHDVILVGGVAGYSDDGSRFAFTARPADGSAGPDVYLWRTEDSEARRVTDDHASLFAGWSGRRMLVSRVVDGEPATVLLNPASGDEESVPKATAWRPSVSPDGRTATWWDGSVAISDDGYTWQPEDGRLVLGAWPEGGGEPQTLATGSLTDWDVHWDADGTVMGLWTTKGGPAEPGRLSLYAVDPETGMAVLDQPLLEPTPAFDGFSLRNGRLAWNAPGDEGKAVLKVRAWSGDTRGELLLPADADVTIIR